MGDRAPSPASETPDLRITYETETGTKRRLSFIATSDRRWLRVEEETDPEAEKWHYQGSDIVTDVCTSGRWVEDGVTDR